MEWERVTLNALPPLKQAIEGTRATTGAAQGTIQVYAWPETERVSPLCPQEWQKDFSELDSVGNVVSCHRVKADMVTISIETGWL